MSATQAPAEPMTQSDTEFRLAYELGQATRVRKFASDELAGENQRLMNTYMISPLHRLMIGYMDSYGSQG